MNADRNLLLGILALQLNFINRPQLIGAFDQWLIDKSKPLAQILDEQGALVPERRTLLEALVTEHLKLHKNDPEQSLADLTPIGSVREELKHLADAELEASLMHVSATREDAPQATQPWSVGTSTSAGTRFRILRPHARGGLGEVYVARDEELHREVALKEIQEHHSHDPSSRARFLIEAEITGGLEHPGVVPVYGLGTYADGRPFYAMRFIKGDSLKDAIKRFHHTIRGASNGQAKAIPGAGPEHMLSIERPPVGKEAFNSLEFRKLLGRFIDVCNAIEYAHSRGVLHRDLKPGNIMLGKYGETLVVDWGLAKVIGRLEAKGDLDERTLQPSSGGDSSPTQMGSAVGTPQYMSPEQADGRLDELGPASDVYSLGATLYTLLTGQPPFPPADLGAILAQVTKGDFPTLRSLNSAVPRPMEAICLKAMSRRPTDRYSGPRALADDIEHWLADEPVTAQSETVVERAARWLRRHGAWARSAALALLTVTLVSVVAIVVVNQARGTAMELAGANQQLATDALIAQRVAEEKTTDAQLARDEKERQRLRAVDAEAAAVQAAKEARHSASTATQVTHFLQRLLVSSDPMGLEGLGFRRPDETVEELTVRQLVDRASVAIESELADQVEVRASILDVIGNVYRGLGQLEQSEQFLAQALSMRQTVFAGRDHPDLATSLHSVGVLRHLRGEYPEAESLYRQALEMRQRLLPAFDLPADDELALASTRFALGWLIIDAGLQINQDRWAEAEQLFQEAYDVRRRLLPLNHPDVANAFGALLAVVVARGPETRAVLMLGQAAAVLNPDDGSASAGEALVLYFRAVRLRARRDYAEAEKLHRQVVQSAKRLLGEHHLLTMLVEADLAGLLMQSGQGAEADQIIERILKRVRGSALHTHPKTMMALRQLARTRRDQKRPEEAERLYVEILQVGRPRLGDRDTNVREAAWNLACLELELGRFNGVEQLDADTVKFMIAMCHDRAAEQGRAGDQAACDLLERAAAELRRRFIGQ